MTPELRELFRQHRKKPLKVTQVEVRRQLGVSRTDTQNFYRLFYKAWKLDTFEKLSNKRK